MNNIVLGREETYEVSPQVWTYDLLKTVVNGIHLNLCNTAEGFPFDFCGHSFTESIRLFMCGQWSNNTEEHLRIQNSIMQEQSSWACYRFVTALNSRNIRNDFPTFQLQWMLFVTWQKCKGNADFRHLLLCIPRDITLIRDKTEDHSQSATLWGCRNMERHNREKRLWKDFSCRGDDQDPKEWRQKLNREREKLKNIGEWKGQNNMGKILMICRDCLIEGTEPSIYYDLLRQSDIYLFGKLLTF